MSLIGTDVGLIHFLVVGALLFSIGICGIITNRRNIISILMSIELILLSVNINFVAFSAHLKGLTGQIFTMLILTVAAAEAAIGLAILISYYRNKGNIEVQEMNEMQG
ncbi:MAG: NADH-quinone oxidoreductase subunit NuoK [Alphaproteobacteria bacterium]|nr:NADH-quinone oxidoreductase subunit NuoK [Alphaproteobacteria bacterium]